MNGQKIVIFETGKAREPVPDRDERRAFEMIVGGPSGSAERQIDDSEEDVPPTPGEAAMLDEDQDDGDQGGDSDDRKFMAHSSDSKSDYMGWDCTHHTTWPLSNTPGEKIPIPPPLSISRLLPYPFRESVEKSVIRSILEAMKSRRRACQCRRIRAYAEADGYDLSAATDAQRDRAARWLDWRYGRRRGRLDRAEVSRVLAGLVGDEIANP